MLPDKNVMCHRAGFKVSCYKGVTGHGCQLWMEILGANPQTGQDFHRYGCADSFVPLLLIENSQMQRQTAGAVESFRNEMVKLNLPLDDTLRLTLNGQRK